MNAERPLHDPDAGSAPELEAIRVPLARGVWAVCGGYGGTGRSLNYGAGAAGFTRVRLIDDRSPRAHPDPPPS